jgi:hypothetical protein
LTRKARGWRLVQEVLREALFRTGFVTPGFFGTLRLFARTRPGLTRPDFMMVVNPYILEVKSGSLVFKMGWPARYRSRGFPDLGLLDATTCSNRVDDVVARTLRSMSAVLAAFLPTINEAHRAGRTPAA